jgi:hypothetical protein
MTETADRILDAALMHVPFDGWSELTLRALPATRMCRWRRRGPCSRAGQWTWPWPSTAGATGRWPRR